MCFIVDFTGCGCCCSLVVMALIYPLNFQPWSSKHHRTFAFCPGIQLGAPQPLWDCSSCGAWRWGSGHFHQPTSQHRIGRSPQASRRSKYGPPWRSLHHHLSMPALPHQRTAFRVGPANRTSLTAKKEKQAVRRRIIVSYWKDSSSGE